MNAHPNASVAGLSGSVTVVAMFLLDSLGVNVPPAVASAITTLIASAVLYVGRRSKKHV